MWKLLQILTAIGVAVLMMKPDHYEAIRHEFCEVWNKIEEAEEEAQPKKGRKVREGIKSKIGRKFLRGR